jgi:hypothetical protein
MKDYNLKINKQQPLIYMYLIFQSEEDKQLQEELNMLVERLMVCIM